MNLETTGWPIRGLFNLAFMDGESLVVGIRRAGLRAVCRCERGVQALFLWAMLVHLAALLICHILGTEAAPKETRQ